ncbi:MAG: sugar transferase, partial [Chloroflexi bacterium]|nr:sugar transferase [Chloroflexota bacterium]
FVSSVVLLMFAPVLGSALLLVWLQDGHDPFYRATRVARGGGDFTMLKIRSMVIGADKSGVNSTANGDRRITALGRFIRRWKLDEISQFINVLRGDMSVVGPRPNTREWGTELYTAEEVRLLELRPGITDLASIVFSDEGAILEGAGHADELYNQVIRPWKSRLGLLYRDCGSVMLDSEIVVLTAVAIVNRQAALAWVQRILRRLGADDTLIAACRRETLRPPEGVPPGGREVFRLSAATPQEAGA